MPLAILLPLVVVGIGGIAVLLHLSGHSRQHLLTSPDDARSEWQRHWPDVAAQVVHLAQGCALVETSQGIGLVRPMGLDTVAHFITDMRDQGAKLHIDFGQFAAPARDLALDEATRNTWMTIWRQSHA